MTVSHIRKSCVYALNIRIVSLLITPELSLLLAVRHIYSYINDLAKNIKKF